MIDSKNMMKVYLLPNFVGRFSAFLKRYADDRLHYWSYLQKLNDPELIEFLIQSGFLKQELPGFYYFNRSSDVPYRITRNYNDFEENFNPLFSVFKNPITNVSPEPNPVNLLHIFRYLKSERAKKQTLELRSIAKRPELGSKCPNKTYKNRNFYYACFSAVLKTRSEAGVVKHSNLLCIDLDHLEDVEAVRQIINNDQHTIMSFVSPNGDGLKAVFRIDTDQSQRLYYSEISRYLCNKCGLPIKKADLGTHDVSRATFLPWDPEAYLNPLIMRANERSSLQNK